jgi:hypothetical protein
MKILIPVSTAMIIVSDIKYAHAYVKYALNLVRHYQFCLVSFILATALLKGVNKKIRVFWDVTPCRLGKVTDVSMARNAFIFRVKRSKNTST